MTPETWPQVRAVFGIALGLDEAERARYLASIAVDVRDEVESLLAAHSEAGQFLEENASAVPAGSRVGPYRIVQKVGEGGMGAVYLATRDAGGFEQRVALKVISAALATEELDRRFLAERQTLARLAHPNIVRLLDGGEWEGRRYFAMEFVTGVPITEYCRNLPLVRTLTMFRTVCSAIHYAHQHLIVHRDIKPANILVTPDGDAKVLDFGIAKLLDSVAGRETTQLQPMSLDCASPEQVKGLPVTTVTDVYALGVLLYELLAGVSPQSGPGRTLDETIRRICDASPERPSTLNRAIPQDLDSVVLRAIQKEPQLRYASAEELSADLGRFLDGRPVIAREATFRYVARKFVARNKLAVAGALMGSVALMAGTGVVFWESRVAARERALAQRRFEETRKLARTVVFNMQSQLATVPGTLGVRRQMIAQTVSYLESMARDAGDDRALLIDLAGSYSRMGEIQGMIGASNLGDSQGAIRSLETALRLLDHVFAIEPANHEALNLAATIHGTLGGLYFILGKRAEATAQLDSAVVAARKFQAVSPDSVASAETLGSALFARATSLSGQDRIRAFEETLVMYESILRRDPTSSRKMRNVALCEKYLSSVLGETGEPQRALQYASRARDLDDARLAQTPGDRTILVDLSNDLGSVGNLQTQLGNASGAVGILRRNLDLRQRLALEDPRDVSLRERLGRAHRSLGWALLNTGDGSGARSEFSASISNYRLMLTVEPGAPIMEEGLLEGELGLAAAMNLLKRPREACEIFVQAQPLMRRVKAKAQPEARDAADWAPEVRQGLKGCGLNSARAR